MGRGICQLGVSWVAVTPAVCASPERRIKHTQPDHVRSSTRVRWIGLYGLQRRSGTGDWSLGMRDAGCASAVAQIVNNAGKEQALVRYCGHTLRRTSYRG